MVMIKLPQMPEPAENIELVETNQINEASKNYLKDPVFWITRGFIPAEGIKIGLALGWEQNPEKAIHWGIAFGVTTGIALMVDKIQSHKHKKLNG